MTAEAREPESPRGGQARTRLARDAVRDAALALFRDRGYAATTIGLISERSGIPAPTVYRLFSSKIGILKSLIDHVLTGDDDPIPLGFRDQVSDLLASADPRVILGGLAGVVRAVNGRASAAHPLLVRAADSDPEAARLLSHYDRDRQQGQGRFARALADAGALRTGLTERDAADVLHALASPDLYRLLVAERGWSPDRFEHWLTDTLLAQLTEGKTS